MASYAVGNSRYIMTYSVTQFTESVIRAKCRLSFWHVELVRYK